MQIKPARRLLSSQVTTEPCVQASMSCVSAFNEMDENHDGKISQSEFVEVKIRICVP